MDTKNKSILFLVEDIAQLLRSEVKKTHAPRLDFFSYLHRLFSEFRNERFKNN
jgi:hypothetical protein